MTVSKQAIATRLTDRLFTRPEAATYLAVKEQTLAAWACKGIGPRFLKLNRAVRYRESELQRFIESREVQSTGEADSL